MAIKRLQVAILEGGSRILNAFPRGFAKTTISENAAIWAVVYGHRRFVLIVGADETAAKDNIESIKTELSTNEMLQEDFPEVCHPISALDGKSQRCRSQTCDGNLTQMVWSVDKVVMPTIRTKEGGFTGSSGSIIVSRGITGRIRGMKHKRADGVQERPGFVILDDFQTDESAASPTQCDKRLQIIKKAILRLTGHKKTMSCVVNATCINEGDCIDTLMDRKKHPEWETMRIPMLKSHSKVKDTWWLNDYATIRRTYNQDDPHDRKRAIAEATAFYVEHQAEADEDAEATWEACYSEGEASAIQHAYNILIDDGPEVFASECQNQPERFAGHANGEFLTSTEMQRNRIGIDTMPPAAVDVVGFHIDVQHRCLYYTVMGATADFSLTPLAYGQFPPQPRGLIPYAEVTHETLEARYPGAGLERAIEMGVGELIDDLCTRVWTREDGVDIEVIQGIIDANDQTQAVRRGIKRSKYPNRVLAAFGRGIKAADIPMMQLKQVEGEKRSRDNAVPWRLTPDRTVIGQRNLFICTNSVKTFLHRRIAAPTGDAGSLEMLNGDHRVYCDQLCESEYPTKTDGPWGGVIEWKARPQRPDNHLLDTTCGAIVAISVTGRVTFSPTHQLRKPSTRKKVSQLF